MAGQFYPAATGELREEISLFLSRPPARERPQGEVVAGIVPHAGYMYSGAVAGQFYSLIAARPVPLAVVISPSHREYFPAISIFRGSAYRTPLGDVKVDQRTADELLQRGHPFVNDWQGHRDEHALEVQLPFLQMIRPQLEIVPIVMGDQKADVCEQLGDALAETLKKRQAIIIASSDLSHYHSHREAQLIDQKVLDCVGEFAPERLLKRLASGEAEACGGGPIVAAMLASRRLGATGGHILDYCDSSAVSGDEHHVVGYLAAAFCRA